MMAQYKFTKHAYFTINLNWRKKYDVMIIYSMEICETCLFFNIYNNG